MLKLEKNEKLKHELNPETIQRYKKRYQKVNECIKMIKKLSMRDLKKTRKVIKFRIFFNN